MPVANTDPVDNVTSCDADDKNTVLLLVITENTCFSVHSNLESLRRCDESELHGRHILRQNHMRYRSQAE